MSIETKHSPELRAYFKARGQPEDSPVWYPSSRELEQALELEVKANGETELSREVRKIIQQKIEEEKSSNRGEAAWFGVEEVSKEASSPKHIQKIATMPPYQPFRERHPKKEKE